LSLALLSLLSVVGVVASEQAIRETGLKDPSVVVIDEWLGQGVALLAVPHSWWGAGLAFVFFRVFDILKPPPVSFLERAPGGVGVMLDDLGAGLLAALLLHYLFLFLPALGGGMA
jgi:phosphatidylglycerophosphatase A